MPACARSGSIEFSEPGFAFPEHFSGQVEFPNNNMVMDGPSAYDTPWVLSLYDHYWYLRDEYKPYTETGKVKIPFLSQPSNHYLGAAWYQREIFVQQYPPSLGARRTVLTLERPHWQTSVWLDGKLIGSQDSLVAPHIYDLGTPSAGRHRITIRVDNRMIMPYRPDAHSVSDSLGATWNGIVGKIQLDDTGSRLDRRCSGLSESEGTQDAHQGAHRQSHRPQRTRQR